MHIQSSIRLANQVDMWIDGDWCRLLWLQWLDYRKCYACVYEDWVRKDVAEIAVRHLKVRIEL